jgi:transcriptional regulator with XRE-family HTH domain
MEFLGFTSLQETAEACDLERGQLYRYFKGENRPSIEYLPRLCKGLEVSLDELLKALSVQIRKKY